MSAGYSGTPLVRKLGVKAGMRATFLHAPDSVMATLGTLDDVNVSRRLGKGRDFIHIFEKSRAKLEARLPQLLDAMATGGMLWISWPKRASKVQTDITEDVLRTIVLPLGWVDVKVCAVDEVWSGLKFMKRKQ